MGFSAIVLPSLTLCYAAPPLGLMMLWLYLIFGIPAAFAVALVGFVYSFSAAGKRHGVHRVHVLALFASLVNAVGVIIVVSLAPELVTGNAIDKLWGGIFIVTVVLAFLGWWRAARSSR